MNEIFEVAQSPRVLNIQIEREEGQNVQYYRLITSVREHLSTRWSITALGDHASDVHRRLSNKEVLLSKIRVAQYLLRKKITS